ncbi:hypothetical protein [Mycolicibacterium sp.]|uniref:hypothetical protein n=1 Tax=Mycolicibacterium sp. TaxID=2320850 RepID=UPI00355D7781
MYALIDQNSIVVSEGDSTLLIAGSDPAHAEVRRYLVDERGADFETVRALVETFRSGVKAAVKAAVSVVDGSVVADAEDEPAYRVVHGDPVEETMLATAIRLVRESSDLAPLGEFLRRLERNPSPASRSQLFGWLKAGGFTLTADGFIVGYKSVRDDGLSVCSGEEPVTVVRQDGTAETVAGRVPYPVGSTVWMPRNLVDDDRHSACSVGLHVGTFNYAKAFAQQMLVVLVDPADVVSVPVCSGAQKMRVCRLRVAARHDGEQISEAVIEHIRTVPDFEAEEEYRRRPENATRPIFSVAAPFGEGEDQDYGDYDEDYDDDDDDDDDDDGFGEGVPPGLPAATVQVR